jgi:DNA repair protein RadA/Sms
MSKIRTLFVCSTCGAGSSQWFGKCPSCNNYGTLEEQIAPNNTNSLLGSRDNHLVRKSHGTASPRNSVRFSEISALGQTRFTSGYAEFDRVLGGGVVPGSLILIGGDPGIGKSTLLLQTAHQLAQHSPRILYVCAEESGQQVKLRASRLGIAIKENNPDKAADIDKNLYILPETDLENIIRELESLRPQAAVIDSIQTLYLSSLSSAPGSVAQVRECTSVLMQVAKRENISLFIVGHVTKEGAIAGPRVLEHLVDTVLYFEGDRYASHRLLRSVKNRFGGTHEIGIFEMVEHGLQEVTNPSELFLGNRNESSPGTTTVVACEGTRPILVELQSLVSPTSYPSPRRSTTGMDYNRLQQILAVLEKRVGIPLSKLDVYVASAGGLAVEEPAADLGIATAVVASYKDCMVNPRTVVMGEIGLGGQIRSIPQLDLRLKEAAKLGFKKAIVPKGQSYSENLGLEILPVGKLIEAIMAIIPEN